MSVTSSGRAGTGAAGSVGQGGKVSGGSERTFLTMAEAAERIHVTPRLIRRLVAERRLRCHKAGRTILIEEQVLLDYLDDHTLGS